MAVDPGIQVLLDIIDGMDQPAISESTPQQARDGFKMMTVGMRQPFMVIPVRDVQDASIPGPEGAIPVRVYRPDADGDLPTIVFFHGGAFVIGDLDTHDNQARRLCRDTESVVVSVDYRLAPEAPWPAGVDDAMAATQWVADHISAYGNEPALLAVAGDSAGGNFAAVVAQLCSDSGVVSLAAQLLIYPATDFDPDVTVNA